MTTTIPYTPAVEDRTASLPLRLMLAPAGTAPALLDGAWWPRSRDLTVELPALTAVLDPLWGRITRVTVNPTFWPVIPRKVPVDGHVVGVGWFKAEQDPHKLLLFSYTVGRWDLLVIPPETAPATAARLMIEAADPLGTLTASALMNAAEERRIAEETELSLLSVWDSEGGHGAGLPASRSPVQAVIAQAPEVTNCV
ncbi:hypothetical protein HEK616_48250 [Streptomyces nigrescens]|uniref:Uncharacterized protein n=2 Tax=Streptomyces TaxID=1883 RepID=A0ABM7ZY95_STRNI|nr:DUF5994 family protein [Streptomyces nigrescens]MEE4421550.1 DUF5994 family protein [Streptomyces sp. DSM 41528]BDM71338.1 hypothetical protein HEK616_48250 [Streptomyces nigrescens]